jgi:hypothetical protein
MSATAFPVVAEVEQPPGDDGPAVPAPEIGSPAEPVIPAGPQEEPTPADPTPNPQIPQPEPGEGDAPSEN